VQDEVHRPFDLSQPPLIRARLLRLAEDHHVLLLTAHHIVCDGWSYDVMTRDFSALYSMAVRGERISDHHPRSSAIMRAAWQSIARKPATMLIWAIG
jgi:NRPS condensation-like uncharacterized protein